MARRTLPRPGGPGCASMEDTPPPPPRIMAARATPSSPGAGRVRRGVAGSRDERRAHDSAVGPSRQTRRPRRAKGRCREPLAGCASPDASRREPRVPSCRASPAGGNRTRARPRRRHARRTCPGDRAVLAAATADNRDAAAPRGDLPGPATQRPRPGIRRGRGRSGPGPQKPREPPGAERLEHRRPGAALPIGSKGKRPACDEPATAACANRGARTGVPGTTPRTGASPGRYGQPEGHVRMRQPPGAARPGRCARSIDAGAGSLGMHPGSRSWDTPRIPSGSSPAQ